MSNPDTASGLSLTNLNDSKNNSNQELGNPTQVRPIDIVLAVYEYNTKNNSNSNSNIIKLSFQPGDTIYVLNKTNSGWWDGFIMDSLNSGKVTRGWFPQTYIRPLRDTYTNSKKFNSVSGRSSRRSSYTTGDIPTNSNINSNSALLNLPISNKIRNKSRKNSFNTTPANKAVNLSTNNNLDELNPDTTPVDPLQTSVPQSGYLTRKQPKGITKNDSISSVSSPSAKKNNKDINVLSLEEVEMIINSLHTPIVSTWNPIPIETKTSVDDKLIFYNKELDIYCSELPLVSMTNTETNLDSSRNLSYPSDDHLIDLNTRRLSTNAKSQTVNTVGITNSRSNDTIGDMKDFPGKKSSTSTDNDDTLSRPTKSETDLRESRSLQPIYRQAILSKNDLFYHHSKDIKTWIELEDLTIHFTKMTRKMFLKIDRFNFVKFFNVMSNLTIFTQISCRLIQQEIKLKMCNREVKRLLKSLISSLSKININSTIYFDSSSTLQVHNTPVPRQPNELLLTTPSPTKQRTQNEYFLDNAFDSRQMAKSVSTDTPTSSVRNISASTTDTLIPSRIIPNTKNFYEINHETNMLYPDLRNTSASSARDDSIGSERVNYDNNPITRKESNVRSIKGNNGKYIRLINLDPAEQDSKISLKLIFENIDQEFVRYMKNIQLLHRLLQNSVLINESHILPQFLPRFFKGSFNGGSWTNPFAAFIYPIDSNTSSVSNSVSRVSTASIPLFNSENNNPISSAGTTKADTAATEVNPANDENHKSSFTDSQISSGLKMPPKMATAIALASGLPISEKVLNSANTSTSNSATDIVSALSLTANKKISNASKVVSRSRVSKRRTKYPLNMETFMVIKLLTTSINDKLSLNFTPDALEFMNQPKTKSRNLEINSRTYEQMNENTQLLDVLENLDLAIFINLKRLIKCPSKAIDNESKEFLRHAMSSISTIITEFYDIKQSFHDCLVRLIMTTQQTTLDDPYVFTSMKSNYKIDFNEPKLLERITLNKKMKKIEKQSMLLYRYLVEQDVEFNNIDFLNTSEDFVDACENYINCINAACSIVEQLIEERENLLNYAARMMKNNLTTELLKGEQEKWFEYSSELNSEDELDDNDYYDTRTSDGNETIMDVNHIEDDHNLKKNKILAASQGLIEDENLPWFLQSDHAYSLVYDNKGKVRGGSKEALIEHLTNHELIDPSFNVALLITFRSIFTTKEFVYALIYRYNLYPPEGLGYDEYNIWIEKKLNPIKCRVINILKIFFQQYWTTSYFEEGLISIENFVKFAISENIPGSDDLLLEVQEILINRKQTGDIEPQNKTGPIGGTKGVAASGSNKQNLTTTRSTLFRLKKLKLLDIDPYNYATQLTILEHDLYSRITLFECLDRVWGNKYCEMGGSKNITNFIMNANTITNFVSSTIVKHSEVKKRCKYIQFFIQVAEHCKALNNFSSMTAVVSALYSSPIYRLKKTWELIPIEDREILKKLNNLMDSKKNFIRYRGLLRSVKDVACVPFFGVYLSDLTFTNAGNPDFLHGSKDLVNFSKRSKIVDIIEEILSFKKFHYKLKRIDDIQGIIKGSIQSVPHIEEQYRLSLQMEPRTDSTNGHNHVKNPLELDTDIK